jgi:hypothetical protein
MKAFSWGPANVEHIAKHGVAPAEAQYVATHARKPFPRYVGDGKWQVWGRTMDGRYLQVIYVYPDDEDVDIDSLSVTDLLAFSAGEAQVVYVIHAMELDDEQKAFVRKRQG